MNNTVLKHVISIAYVLIYIGANPNIFAGNAIVLLFFFFYGLTVAIESKQRFDAIILIPILVFSLIFFFLFSFFMLHLIVICPDNVFCSCFLYQFLFCLRIMI